jgi:KUP system potassium uptake protein
MTTLNSDSSIEDAPCLPDKDGAHSDIKKTGTIALAIAALGVVYGDIGTSPLYAIKECFHGLHAIGVTHTNVLGVLSLVFWSLAIVICFKYVIVLSRADNQGEGGIFALLALISSDKKKVSARTYATALTAAIFGAALLYGDGIITPAISVLSAIEGLSVATRALTPAIVPLTCIVLFVLFILQHRGTAKIGNVFGPIMIVWFAAIAVLGLLEIVKYPQILSALNPAYAVRFFIQNGFHGIVVLGSVVLCITGGEALYADLGHFGRGAIQISWLTVAFPALVLNYFGQGALLLAHPGFAFNPFYGLVPRQFLYLMVGLSTMATVIASQAMITGVFSLTQKAVQMGYCPRIPVIHTSTETIGQIYIAPVNYTLMTACIALVLLFRHSSGLAGAYGVAVTATMGITSIIYFVVIRQIWGWSRWKSVPLLVLFLVFDLSYFGANILKIFDGGWFPLATAAAIMIAMSTWRDGRKLLASKMLNNQLPLKEFLEDVGRYDLPRVHGTAVFMTVSPVGTPSALLHHIKHNHVLHEQVIILSIRSLDIPFAPPDQRIEIEDLGEGFYRILGYNGFMEAPDAPEFLRIACHHGLITKPMETSYFLGRETLLTTGRSKMMSWRKMLFALMVRNAQTAPAYFGITPGRVIELGIQIEL